MREIILLLHFLIHSVAASRIATNLYVSSYAGTVSSLQLLRHNNGTYDLKKTFTNNGCRENPAWLTLDSKNGILYCLDEGLNTPNGSVSTFETSREGNLTQIDRQISLVGPVSGVLYGCPDNPGFAMAHYVGSAVTTWKSRDGALTPLQNITFTLDQPGPVADRQEAPHEHEAILDPTGQYILVPDLGADLVRVFCFDPQSYKLQAHDPLKLPPGSGPRHATFWVPDPDGKTTYLYVVTELTNAIIVYSVSYKEPGGLEFNVVFDINTFGGQQIPTGAAAAEIAISPDNRFLMVSNRNDTSFLIDNPDPNNSTLIQSDSLASFTLQRNGSLNFLELFPSGGSFPRHFSINKAGDMVAVANQLSSRVVVLSRDVKSGKLAQPARFVDIEGEVNCVIWDE